ncbi:hypothetical protein ACHAW5_000348 [Stephanodiscus triporus]|uniref:GST N-terminal domain-containing protein n=1 Tax=Stephanodiscus triporus TaxID=2934178 RepID=A0ABD3MI62_9STRA
MAPERSGNNDPATAQQQFQRHTLTFYDRITSNNAARIRLWMRLKGLSSEFHIAYTTHDDQVSDERFASINPNRKIPLLLLEDGVTSIPESAVILQYLEERFASVPPSLLPATPEGRAHMNLAIQYHDIYISCFYVPPAPDVGVDDDCGGDARRGLSPEMRAAKLADVWRQLDVLESHCTCDPYLSGSTLSLADVTLLPTAFYVVYYGPRSFGWEDDAVWTGRPKLRGWYYDAMLELHEEARTIVGGMREALDGSADVRARIDSIRRQTEDHPRHKWIYP